MDKNDMLDDAIKGARNKLKQARRDFEKTGSINSERRVSQISKRLSFYGTLKENEEITVYQLLNKTGGRVDE